MGRRERPLDPEAGPLQSFAFELRRLRQAAGRLSYRELARRAHYSKTVLSEAVGGRELPTLAVTLAYVDSCGGDQGEWEARWCALAAELTPNCLVTSDVEAPDEAAAGDCPYLGLAAFQPEDAERFFGREQLVADLVTRLDQTPFLAVFGPSGSGKSSVLRAGLLPEIWGGSRPETNRWTTILLTPGPHPLEELAMRVALVAQTAPGELLEELRASPGCAPGVGGCVG
ncbi:MAG: nSTAND1 domain-containing NTPase [Pseudonocardiales bacterium]